MGEKKKKLVMLKIFVRVSCLIWSFSIYVYFRAVLGLESLGIENKCVLGSYRGVNWKIIYIFYRYRVVFVLCGVLRIILNSGRDLVVKGLWEGYWGREGGRIELK